MDILSIGNSFSADAQRYLHQIAKADGFKLNAFNLFIGGCPLSRHYRNMLTEEAAYQLQMNGESTGFKVSLKDALLNREWDVITIQQASHQSTDYENYQPYINKLVEYVRLCQPKAKIAVHQTWAYEQDSPRLKEKMGYNDQFEMFKAAEAAYKKAAEEIGADFLIPSGTVFQKLLEAGVEKVHRDSFHASYGLGRYTLGLLWYTMLSGKPVAGNSFCDFDEEITEEEIAIAKKCVAELCGI